MQLPVSDRLFRHAFSTQQSARELAENVLPPSYRRRIAGARVTVERSSYVDQALRDHVTDLLIRFDTPSGAQLYLYVLVDHKSQPQRWAPLQLLRYVAQIYSDLLRRKKQPRRLPEIVPLVLYTGAKRWGYSLQLAELVAAAGNATHVPRFRPLLVDLARRKDSAFNGSVRTVVALLFLKYLSRRIDRAAAGVLLQAMHREPLTPELREFFQSCYRALAARKEAEEIAVLVEAAKSYGYPDTQEDLMTWEQEVKTKGRQEGISLGQLRDKQDVLIRLLDRKFGIGEAERELIREVEDPVRLDAALDEILFAENRDAVLEKLGTRGCP